MGRYYSGDIEGKFWFGVQGSDDADFFGASGSQPERLEYYFNKEEHLESIKEGVKTCIKKLGENKAKLDKFFDEHNGYNDEMLVKAGFKKEEVNSLLRWYARLHLGEKILKYVEEHGECSFDAEC